MTGHGVLILVSVNLPPKENVLLSDLKALLALEDPIILFGDLNRKSMNWNCNYSTRNHRKMVALTKDLLFNIVKPLTSTHYPSNNNHSPDILDIALMKRVALKVSYPSSVSIQITVFNEFRYIYQVSDPDIGPKRRKEEGASAVSKTRPLLPCTTIPNTNNSIANTTGKKQSGYLIALNNNALVTPRKTLNMCTGWKRRRAAEAPWYIKNSIFHGDLELPNLSIFMNDGSERFFDTASSHPNQLFVSAVSHEPLPPYHFCRRPRNNLSDPPDNLTVAVEKLLEVNKMVIDYE
ncbi:hypothetical protein EVAR_41677_1 [Eumeta japonica]|uniref:Endonuclease/exonuclease/phosphatase domain-containing protein n=1 Tax=Eumeta variegata TaxID=151549 RepID=A0A4C1VQH1_EUMVA|nr:hypothetical protein EVAR_41677_1 [Eumeta japonica]